jgi:hypothetical protein
LRVKNDYSDTLLGPQPHPGFIGVFGQAALDGGDGEVEGAVEVLKK